MIPAKGIPAKDIPNGKPAAPAAPKKTSKKKTSTEE